jgi:hypothetical protein
MRQPITVSTFYSFVPLADAQSLWHDDCFVFDERVGVGHGLAPMQAAA